MLYDISPLVSEATAVWPGDVAFSRTWQCRLEEGSNLDLSSFTTTVHIGAHADAPSHYAKHAPSIEGVGLEAYWGKCQVLTCEKILIEPHDFADRLDPHVTRVLFRTLSFTDPQVFKEDFSAFTPESIESLGERGIVLVGIDTPSVDPFASKALPAHHMLLRYGIRNLEGLDLRAVTDGLYELVALPLKLQGFDASPVRAVLRDLQNHA